MKRMRWVASVPVLAFLACGGGGGGSAFDYNPNSSAKGGGTGSGATGTGAGMGTNTDPSGKGGGYGSTTSGAGGAITTVAPPAEVCAKDQAIAEVNPLAIFIMEDRSLSMRYAVGTGETKWKVITDALQTFLVDPASAGLQVGVGFFAQFVNPSDTTDLPDVSCDESRYSTPAVGIGPVETTATPILSAFAQIYPQGETPTRVAEIGAVTYAKAWAAANPTYRVVVILATDGDPNVCESSVISVANAATSGAQHSIRTYVIGVVDDDKPGETPHRDDQIKNMNRIASGGNTGAAFIVNSTSGTAAQFAAAMKAIRNSNKMVCQFDIPRSATGDPLDMTAVAVTYNAAPLPYMASSGLCGAGAGWYYNDPRNPTGIRLCNSTCDQVQTDPNAKVEFVFGCKPPPPAQMGGSAAGGTVDQGGTPVTETGGIPDGGNGGEPQVDDVCLLDGQSCTSNSVCCSNFCNNLGTCGVPVN